MVRPDMAGRSYLLRIAQPVVAGTKPLRARFHPAWDEPPPQQLLTEILPPLPVPAAAIGTVSLSTATPERAHAPGAPEVGEPSHTNRGTPERGFGADTGDAAPPEAATITPPTRSDLAPGAAMTEPPRQTRTAETPPRPHEPSSPRPASAAAPILNVVHSRPTPVPEPDSRESRRFDASEPRETPPARVEVAARAVAAPLAITTVTAPARSDLAAGAAMNEPPQQMQTAGPPPRPPEPSTLPRQTPRGIEAADDPAAQFPARSAPTIASPPEPRVRIGTVEVRLAPPAAPVPAHRPAAPPARSSSAEMLSRGLANRFGLIQG